MRYNWFDTVMSWFVNGLLVFAVAMVAIIAVEVVQEYRTFDEQVACKEQRMEPVRKLLSGAVTCVPAIMRNDTTTVNLP